MSRCLAAAQFVRCRPSLGNPGNSPTGTISGNFATATTENSGNFATGTTTTSPSGNSENFATGTGFPRRASRLWKNLNDARRSLCEDVGEWGIGAVPIFNIIVSSNGRLQVQIDEEEISGRCGLQSLLSRHNVDAAQQIAKARKLARDIEQGMFHPPPTSTLYRFVKEGDSAFNEGDSAVKEGDSTKQATWSSDPTSYVPTSYDASFVIGGLALGLALSVLGIIFLKKPQVIETDTEVTETDTDATPSRLPVDEPAQTSGTPEVTGKMLKIRGMVKQARIDEYSSVHAQTEEDDLAEPLQYAAAIRSHFLKSRSQQQVESLKGDDGQIGGEQQVEAKVNVGDDSLPEEATGLDNHPMTAKPHIITSYLEAREVLAKKRTARDEKPVGNIPSAAPIETEVGVLAQMQTETQTGQEEEIVHPVQAEEENVQPILGTSNQVDDVGQEEIVASSAQQMTIEEQTGQKENVRTAQENVRLVQAVEENIRQAGQKEMETGEASLAHATKAGQMTKPRIITSYEEACQVLAARKKRTTRPMTPENIAMDSPSAADDNMDFPSAPKEADGNMAPNEVPGEATTSKAEEVPKDNGKMASVEPEPESVNPSPTPQSLSEKPKRRVNSRIATSSGEPSNMVAAKKPAKTKEKKIKTARTSDSRNVKEASSKKKTSGDKVVDFSGNDEIATLRKSSQGATAAVQKYLSDKAAGINEQPKESRIVITGNRYPVKEPELPKNDKKVWHTELKRRYDRETDPTTRAMIREFGKDLKSWLPESDVKEMLSLVNQGIEGQRELLRRWVEERKERRMQQGRVIDEEEADKIFKRQEKINERIQKQIAMFGPNAMSHKYRDYNPRKPDYLWWFDLQYVACVYLRNKDDKTARGLYSMDMAKEGDEKPLNHVIAFEEQKDALNFCRILVPTLDEDIGGETGAAVIPYEPKKLFREAAAGGYKVTVMRKGQLELYAGKPLYEVQDRILELGRDYYVQEGLRLRSIDFNAVIEDVGRGL